MTQFMATFFLVKFTSYTLALNFDINLCLRMEINIFCGLQKRSRIT